MGYQGESFVASVLQKAGELSVNVGEERCPVRIVQLFDGEAALELSGYRCRVSWAQKADVVTIFMRGEIHEFGLMDELAVREEEKAGGDTVLSPMPGLVRLVSAASGQVVSAGDALLVLEAMKMEHTLRAPRDGIVAEIFVSENEQVEAGSVMVSLEPEDE